MTEQSARSRRAIASAAGGTELVGVHENLPPGVSPADNEIGWRVSIDKLAHLAELRDRGQRTRS